MLISLVGTRYMATNFVHGGHSDGRTGFFCCCCCYFNSWHPNHGIWLVATLLDSESLHKIQSHWDNLPLVLLFTVEILSLYTTSIGKNFVHVDVTLTLGERRPLTLKEQSLLQYRQWIRKLFLSRAESTGTCSKWRVLMRLSKRQAGGLIWLTVWGYSPS